MKLKTRMAIGVCHLARWAMRKLGRGGTDLPGRLALKMDSNILKTLSDNMAVILVTGTNGKTTVCRMIEQGLKEAGICYLANRSGANLMGGIVNTLCDRHLHGGGKHKVTHAVIECDEAAFVKVSRTLQVSCIVVTNIFRDQLDRYGEITTIRGKIEEGICNLPKAVLCLNADCSLTASLGRADNTVVYYGIEKKVLPQGGNRLSDAEYCFFCKSKYEFDYQLYGHLGGFCCPYCGYRRPEPQIKVQRMIWAGQDMSTVEMDIMGEVRNVTIGVPGGFNVSNAAAAAAALVQNGQKAEQIAAAMERFECGFGRSERFELGKAVVRMMLVKNPAGFNQVIEYIRKVQGQYRLVLLLNDKPADGTDISWIWDVDFESLAERQEQMEMVLVSGIRSAELMVRLKYAGFNMSQVDEIENPSVLLDRISGVEGPVFMVPSYTAMFEIRRKIEERTGIRAFYE